MRRAIRFPGAREKTLFIRYLLLLASIHFCLGSCSKERTLVEPPLNADIFGKWLFSGFETVGDTIIPPYPGESIFLNIHVEGKFDGVTNCNTYEGAFHFNRDGTFHLDSLQTSFVGFEPSSDMDFFDALVRTTRMVAADTTLYLVYGPAGKRMNFVRR